MFPFDVSAMPTLPTRKGLLVVDFQNDFLSAGGALPVTDSNELVTRTLELVKSFRRVGDVIWVSTEFEKYRLASAEQIWATDAIPKPKILQSRARRRHQGASNNQTEETFDADPEAFLSQPGPEVVRTATTGAEFPVAVNEAVGKRDIKLIKSHYSAFTSGQLLQTLRVNFIHELYLCGSLANIGVYATAMDAAKFGYSITLVEDCCGFRSDLRQSSALRSLIDVTGCEVQDSEAVTEKLQPNPVPKSNSTLPVVPKRVAEASGGKTPPSAAAFKVKLEEQLANLSLNSSSSSRNRPSSLRTRRTIESSDCATLSDDLEVDNNSLLPQTDHAGGSPDKEVHKRLKRPISSKGVSEMDAASVTQKTAIKGSQILQTTTDEKATFTSDIELEPDSSPELKPEAAEKLAAMHEKIHVEEASRRATEPICEGDTIVVHNILPPTLAEGIFEKVRDEVSWQRMSHQGGEVPRLVAVQGEVADDGSMPVYRHPSDESPPLLPFSPTLQKIKAEVEKQLGHPLNHALIQFYRNGTDYISEHSDKTLDIVKGSYIANVSLGAERTMVFRTKRRDKDPSSTATPSGEDSQQRQIARAKLPHNSLCRLGLVTNGRWLHAIRQDKRADRDKTRPELAFLGGRISLTFRQIGTFLNRDSTLIWGQGATSKTRETAHSVINGQSPEAVGMLHAFGTENHLTEFDWDKYYGKGFDVLHMSTSPRLFDSADPIVNMRIALMLTEYGMTYAKGSMSPPFNWKDGNAGAKDTHTDLTSLPIRFVDNDAAKSTVQGELAVMLYLDSVHGSGNMGAAGRAHADIANIFTRFQEGLALLDNWRRLERDGESGRRDLGPLKRELAIWEGYASEADYIAGSSISLADFAVWPVLHVILEDANIDILKASKLRAYYERIKSTKSATKVLDAAQPDKIEVALADPKTHYVAEASQLGENP
ncbi:isochorismatase [Colletotrichum orchidophilum]|uniref:Isochorismatase n=1 Tax=Colletotrichum orchidophilum TaxID=1209926 RepID=A0A1G4B066_9PEZI|nr:isochorismatase [Colletotrichum orchidophilum]OHE94692.1 isochorismatase [Colletotrichum orchidophilum]